MKFINHLVWWILGLVFLAALGLSFYMLYNFGYSWFLITAIGFYAINTISTIFLVNQSRHAGAKLAWFMVLSILPIFGHVMFVVFGQRYRDRKEVLDYQKHRTFKYEDETKLQSQDILKKQSRVSKRGVYNSDIELHPTGAQGFKALFEDMKKAKHFIHLNYYIIKPGEIYEQFKSILIEKAKKGVEIRFIIDDFGRWGMPWYEIRFLKKHGIKIAIFGKVNFPFISSSNGYRNHKKMTIIDGLRVHTGGINISNEYAHLDKNYGLWYDYQTTISGEAVRSYSLLFIKDWEDLTGQRLNIPKYLKEKKGKGTSKSVLVEETPEIQDPIFQDALVSWIANAKKSIKIATPYFVPTPEVISALRNAALSGVDINIYLPGKPDKKIVLMTSIFYANLLTKHGIKFKLLDNIYIHSKIGVFDEKYAYFGTANIDIRSMYSQFETISLVEGQIVKDLNNLIKTYDKFSNSKKIKQDLLIISKLKEVFIRIFSPLM